MSLTIIQPGQLVIRLAAGQGPAGPSTVQAEEAAAQANLSKIEAAGSALAAEASAFTSQQAAAETQALSDLVDQKAQLVLNLDMANLSGAKAYASYALALQDLASLTANQSIFVVVDETRENQGTYYRANGTPVTSLVFLRFHEYYHSPINYIQSDSLRNMITKLLVLVEAIPQNRPVIDANFADTNYL